MDPGRKELDEVTVVEMLSAFGRWLDHQRGLASVTIGNYLWGVEQFLVTLPAPVQVSVSDLDARAVTRFVVEFSQGRNSNSVKSMARSLRSFLRFAHATGLTPFSLSGAVPTPASWHLASLPMAVPAADLERLLAVSRSAMFTVNGRRDYAIVLLLARLGLRRGEVAALRLEDIDWRAGELTVVGKGDRVERLPLPAEPGEAIAVWLTDGRPGCQTRAVFTTLRPAGRPMTAGAIAHVVRTASRTAGLGVIGAHRLRHSLATEMLRAGASLSDVGQVLRHRSDRSTAIYAKIDQSALAPLARPWPGAMP